MLAIKNVSHIKTNWDLQIQEKEYTYIQFTIDPPTERKTFSWHCYNIRHGWVLGCVKWQGAWRQYCFYAAGGCVFNKACLNDIAGFLTLVNNNHIKLKKLSKEAQNGK